jgi:hypothetical protein
MSGFFLFYFKIRLIFSNFAAIFQFENEININDIF